MRWFKLYPLQNEWKMATLVALSNARATERKWPNGHVPDRSTLDSGSNSIGLGISRVTSEFSFTTNRNRDGHNYAATMKPIIDQLVKMGVWPDDNTKYVLDSTPILVVDKTRPETVRIHVEEIESARPTSAG
jgi:hypothetical protein